MKLFEIHQFVDKITIISSNIIFIILFLREKHTLLLFSLKKAPMIH